jgi:hypothetical protein
MERSLYRTAVAACVLAGLAAWRAEAQEYCVACSEPNALYRCVIDGAQPRGGQSLQMLCVTALAKEGRHATCSVKRGTVFECDGAVKHVPWAALNVPAQPDAAQPPPWAVPAAARPEPAASSIRVPPPAPAPAAAAPPPEGPPQTMVEFAKRANEKTAEQMKKAGDTVKDATKKTWDCMLSLFTHC